MYEKPSVQIAVASLIFGNFIVSALFAQLLPEEGSTLFKVFGGFEWFFNVSFTIELIWNMYGSWFIMFWESGWNWFDFIIVIISLLSQALPSLPGITVLRLFRAFRVFRLFKRIKSLKRIIEGVLRALPGVMQAFVVMFIIMGIWSVIGVEFFYQAMPEHFGTWLQCMFTMWQIMTGDSWASNIGRTLIEDYDYPLAAIYLICYVFIAGIVMTNVVVAILLDKYLDAGIDDGLQCTVIEGSWIAFDQEKNELEITVWSVDKGGDQLDPEGNKNANDTRFKFLVESEALKDAPIKGQILDFEDDITCNFTREIYYTLDKSIENKKMLWIEDGEDNEKLIKITWTYAGDKEGIGGEFDEEMVWTRKDYYETKVKNPPFDPDQSEIPLDSVVVRRDDESIIDDDTSRKLSEGGIRLCPDRSAEFLKYKGGQFKVDLDSAIGSVFDDESDDRITGGPRFTRSIEKAIGSIFDDESDDMRMINLSNMDAQLQKMNLPSRHSYTDKGLLDHYHSQEERKRSLPHGNWDWLYFATANMAWNGQMLPALYSSGLNCKLFYMTKKSLKTDI